MKLIFFWSDTSLGTLRHVFFFVAWTFCFGCMFGVVGCSTTVGVEKKRAESAKPREITILIPEIEGIDDHPCDNPDWTKLPPKVGSPAIGDAPVQLSPLPKK